MNQKRHALLKKKLTAERRMKDAKVWLRRPMQKYPKSLMLSYSKRYSVSKDIAFYELNAIGFRDQVQIEVYERDGIEWDYKVDGYSGDEKLVPKGTADWELYLF